MGVIMAGFNASISTHFIVTLAAVLLLAGCDSKLPWHSHDRRPASITTTPLVNEEDTTAINLTVPNAPQEAATTSWQAAADGPGPVRFSHPDQLETEVYFPVAGTYTLTVTIDGQRSEIQHQVASDAAYTIEVADATDRTVQLEWLPPIAERSQPIVINNQAALVRPVQEFQVRLLPPAEVQP
jgi:hypothetical protein